MPGKRAPKNIPSKTRKRFRKEKETEEEVDPTVNYHLQQDDEDDEDIQAQYQEEGGTIIEGIYIPPVKERHAHPHTGERLVIEKIVCENFKSYGGVKEMGPFHKSFSAIVGPNGNGKSNIIDAMLFVFGYRAAKIRCKKVSILIHKSELLPNVDSCAVTVHFVKIVDNGEENSDDYEVVPNSQIKVLRRAYKDNSSVYWLANKRVKFQDVAAFLNKNGIDIVHNRFLILQGEVESIAQMQPKSVNGHEAGLLEFLEEVIGSHRYIKCISQLNQMCDILSYQREEKLQRVDLVEREKRAMMEPVKIAKDFLRGKNAQSRVQHMIYQKIIHGGRKTFSELETEKDEFDVKVKEVKTRLDEINKINRERRATFEALEKVCRQIEKQYAKAIKAMEDIDKRYISMNQDIKNSNDHRKKAVKDLKASETEFEKIQYLPDNFVNELGKLEKRMSDLKKEIAVEEKLHKSDIEKLEKIVEDKETEKATSNIQLETIIARIDKQKELYENAIKDCEAYKNQEIESKIIFEKAREEFEKLTKISDGIEEEKKKTQNKNMERKKGVQTELNKLQHEKQQMHEYLVQLEKQHVEASAKYEKAKEATGANNQDRVYKCLLAAKANGEAPGFRGKVKDLATIDEKYNVGATVTNSILHNYVADDEEEAAKCVEVLKRNGIPPQTFLVIKRMDRYLKSSRAPFRTPKDSQRIFDLLKMQAPDLAPVYFKCYSNTLICDTADIALKVSRQVSSRVVACNGTIVTSAGSMSGGGSKRRVGLLNSGMSKVLTSNLTAKDVDQYKADFENVSSKYENIKDKFNNLEKLIHEKTTELKDNSMSGVSGGFELDSIVQSLPLMLEKLRQRQVEMENAKVVPKILKEKEQKLEILKNEVEVIDTDVLQARVDKLTEELNDVRDKKLANLRKKWDRLVEQRQKVNDEISRLTLELRNTQKNKSKLQQSIVAQVSKVKDLEDAMKEKVEEKSKLEEKAKGFKEEITVQTEKCTTTKGELEQHKQILGELDGEQKALVKKRTGLENEITAHLLEMKKIDASARKITQLMEALPLVDVPEEEVAPLAALPEDELETLNIKDLEHKLVKIGDKLSNQTPNLNILDDYKKKVDQFLLRVQELDEITARRDKVREQLVLTSAYRLREFMEAFVQISSKLTEMFRMISMGGDAELTLVDNTSPFTSGIEFCVRPSRKTWKKISNLSGGEKTLSSLALVFALHYYKPSPFYVMDEIDAALDYKNVSIIANYIKDRTKFTQFIIISLRSNMFELADSLLGVYKVDNMSYSIHIGVRRLLNQLRSAGEGRQLPATTTTLSNGLDAGKGNLPESQNGLLDNNLSAIADGETGESEMCTGTNDLTESDDDFFQSSQIRVEENINVAIKESGNIPQNVTNGNVSNKEDKAMEVDEDTETTLNNA